jgi:hypothetical protein
MASLKVTRFVADLDGLAGFFADEFPHRHDFRAT